MNTSAYPDFLLDFLYHVPSTLCSVTPTGSSFYTSTMPFALLLMIFVVLIASGGKTRPTPSTLNPLRTSKGTLEHD